MGLKPWQDLGMLLFLVLKHFQDPFMRFALFVALLLAVPAAAFLDMGDAETQLLASICEAASLADENFLYNAAANQRAEKMGQDVSEVNVMALYTELARRSVAEDALARRALTMAMLRGDKRAKEAKQLAYADKLADSAIKRMDEDDAGAREELEKLAAKGNARARNYLGMDKPSATSGVRSSTAEAVTAAPMNVSASAEKIN
jgi:hypothetical protein